MKHPSGQTQEETSHHWTLGKCHQSPNKPPLLTYPYDQYGVYSPAEEADKWGNPNIAGKDLWWDSHCGELLAGALKTPILGLPHGPALEFTQNPCVNTAVHDVEQAPAGDTSHSLWHMAPKALWHICTHSVDYCSTVNKNQLSAYRTGVGQLFIFCYLYFK